MSKVPLLRIGSTGAPVTRLQKSINARRRARGLTTIAVDGILGPVTWAAWLDTFHALGGDGFSGSVAAAQRRWIVVRRPQRRTAAERRRAAVWSRAQSNTLGRPKIIRLDAPMSGLYGPLGSVIETAGHYTAGPVDTSDAHAVAMWRTYNAQHRAQGWGGIGYHYGVTRAGSIVLLRPVGWKGAHVAGANTGRPGVVVHGSVGDRPTAAQRAAFRWLLRFAHTDVLPASHRAPRQLEALAVKGHNDFNATSCPGAFKQFFTSKGAQS